MFIIKPIFFCEFPRPSETWFHRSVKPNFTKLCRNLTLGGEATEQNPIWDLMHRKGIKNMGYFILPNLLFLFRQFWNHSQAPSLIPPTHTYFTHFFWGTTSPHYLYSCHSAEASNHIIILINHGHYSRVWANVSNKAIQTPYLIFLCTEPEKTLSLFALRLLNHNNATLELSASISSPHLRITCLQQRGERLQKV